MFTANGDSMRKLLASAIGVLLVSALIAAGVQSGPTASFSAPTTGAVPAGTMPLRSTGLPSGLVASGTAAATAVNAVSASPASAPATSAASAKRTFATASPAMFNVERSTPKVDERLTTQLAAAAPADRLVVLVHAADAAFARQAAESNGLAVVATFAKVGVVGAVGLPENIRSLSTVRGISYLEGDQPLSYFQETSHITTRGAEARKGFSVDYEEAQPDIPGSSRQECTTKKNKRGRVVRDKKGRPVKTCRTITTPPQPQPPITRTLTSPGVDGSGVTVAVIDSGVDAAHPMFQQGGKTKVVQNLKFVGFPQCTTTATNCAGPQGNTDDNFFVPVTDSDSISLGGHGTHVAGIAAGVDVTTADGKKAHGAATGAKLVSLSVGAGLNIIGANAALNWVLEHHKDPCGKGACPPIKVTNNSYGPTGGGEFNPESVTAKLQRALVTEGVVTVWANGNGDAQNVGGDGSDNRSNPPGQDPTPGILSVANYDDGGAANRDNLLDSSSSRGNKGRPLTYPDISAPGSDILSACRPQLAICRGSTTTDLNYGVISGTSMAAPHIAGIVAQLFQANPNLTPGEVEDALEDTARPFAFGGSYEPDITNDGITSFDKGHGLVDVVGAVARARLFHVFPAGSTPCLADGPVSVDPAGDARDAASAENTPLPNEPALDVREGRVAWDSASQTLTMSIKVADLGTAPLTRGSDGEQFNFWFTHIGTEYRANATRSGTGAQTFTLTGAAATAPKPTGSFDAAADIITINLPAAALKTATVTAPTDGTALLNLFVWSRRVAGAAAPVADRTGGLCPFTLGLGAVPPPLGTTTGPDPAPKAVAAPLTSKATLAPGGAAYSWTAGPFTSANVEGGCAEALTSPCDVRGVTLEVPEGGATFEVTVTPSNPTADFDLTVSGPDGKVLGTSAGAPVVDSATSTEKVVVKVTTPGIYRIEVNPYTTINATFKGEAKLR